MAAEVDTRGSGLHAGSFLPLPRTASRCRWGSSRWLEMPRVAGSSGGEPPMRLGQMSHRPRVCGGTLARSLLSDLPE